MIGCAPTLRVEIAAPPGSGAGRGLGRWLAAAAPRRARGDVVVALLSDRRMRQLNRRYRRVDRTTDVLSFPSGDRGRFPVGERRFLGEIAIATGVSRRQARRFGHSVATELRVLALHGLLHLLGYDHEIDRGRMDRLERQLRRRAGLTKGLIERGPVS